MIDMKIVKVTMSACLFLNQVNIVRKRVQLHLQEIVPRVTIVQRVRPRPHLQTTRAPRVTIVKVDYLPLWLVQTVNTRLVFGGIYDTRIYDTRIYDTRIYFDAGEMTIFDPHAPKNKNIFKKVSNARLLIPDKQFRQIGMTRNLTI